MNFEKINNGCTPTPFMTGDFYSLSSIKEEKQTEIQKKIENVVTNYCGFETELDKLKRNYFKHDLPEDELQMYLAEKEMKVEVNETGKVSDAIKTEYNKLHISSYNTLQKSMQKTAEHLTDILIKYHGVLPYLKEAIEMEKRQPQKREHYSGA